VAERLTICAISDTHRRHEQLALPPADVLVHSGDFSGRGQLSALDDFNDWLGRQPHRHKIFIAGNHDFCFELKPERARERVTNALYLQDAGVEIEGFYIWGSPWQPWFLDWAFNLKRGLPLREKWDLIPTKTDILLTHGPPMNILDRCLDGRRVGCEELVGAIQRVRPALHVFGHIHEAAGAEEHDGTLYVNASVCSVSLSIAQEPRLIELTRDAEGTRARLLAFP